VIATPFGVITLSVLRESTKRLKNAAKGSSPNALSPHAIAGALFQCTCIELQRPAGTRCGHGFASHMRVLAWH